MKRSKIIFSMVFIAMGLISTVSMAQTRVTISTGIIAPYGYPPNSGYVYYGPQPAYAPCGYYAPRGHYRQPCGQPPVCNNHHHPNNGYGNGRGYGNRNRQGGGNHPHHY